MSGKHNTKHLRSKSRYPERLRARGLERSPMPTLESLQRKQSNNNLYPPSIPSAHHTTYNPGRDK